MENDWCVVYWFDEEMKSPHLFGTYPDRESAFTGLESCWANPQVAQVRMYHLAKEDE